jgi:hypothetical protein
VVFVAEKHLAKTAPATLLQAGYLRCDGSLSPNFAIECGAWPIIEWITSFAGATDLSNIRICIINVSSNAVVD